jgi:uncharacterized protein with PhoU and TrkA domain
MAENVKNLIEEVKNLSELMLDLAYSSVFFESQEIAKEVLILYSDLEELEEKLYLHLFAASRGREAKKLISVIDLVETSKFVATAARNLSEVILEGGELHPVIKEALKESDESITRVTVFPKSMLVDSTLGKVRLRTEVGVNVIAVRRGKKWVFDPNKNLKIEKDDILIAVGPKAGCDQLRRIANGEVKKI